MKLRIEFVDSHQKLPEAYWNILGSFYAEEVWGGTAAEAAERVRDLFCEYEAEYAVKWFEVLAYDGEKLCGCMRILRNPSDRTRWYFCDVHTGRACRRKGIAAKMYEEAIRMVESFYAAEYIQASVHEANTASIALHGKMDFYDTGVPSAFANFWFEPGETMYERRLLLEYPVVDAPFQRKVLYRLYRGYQKSPGGPAEGSAAEAVKQMLREQGEYRLIFCGNRAVGFRYQKGKKKILYIEK